MNIRNYTHKSFELEYLGGLDLRLKGCFKYLRKEVNNGVLVWRINRENKISINQLKQLINGNTTLQQLPKN